jgi:hypothetical protein
MTQSRIGDDISPAYVSPLRQEPLFDPLQSGSSTMKEDCGNPSLRLRDAAEVIHKAAVHYRWAGRSYKKTYVELEKTDPIGFEEFNQIVAVALEAADQIKLPGPPTRRCIDW